MFLEYKYMIQKCVDIFVLDLWILYLQERLFARKVSLIFFHQRTLKEMMI